MNVIITIPYTGFLQGTLKMNIVKRITGFFLSLRTSVWLLVLIIIFFLAGALIMPGRQEFQSIHSIPIFKWLEEQPLSITWWLWCLMVILIVLTLNTLFCSVDSVIKKRHTTHWLLLISPQIIHAGFLFILFAHLLSAAGSFQSSAVAGEGSLLKIPGSNMVMEVEEIDIRDDSQGYITDWEVSVKYLSEDSPFYNDTIKPNKPSVRNGFNINVKDLRKYPQKAVLLQINKEPGAKWALAGGVLFMVGIFILIVLRIKMER